MFALPVGTSVVPAYQEAWGGAVLLRVTLQTHGRWGSPAHQMQWMGRETPREQQALPSAIIRRGSPLGTTEPLVHVRWMKETNEGMEFRIGYSPVLTPVNSERFEGSQISHDHRSLS